MKLASIFSDNMVLQRDKYVSVFGEAEKGQRITVEIDGITRTAKANGEGKWLVKLPPHKSGGAYTLKVTCQGEEKICQNVVYGEVWLAGGQSNMELELQNCAEKSALSEDKNPNVRFYYTQKKTIREKDFFECEDNACWSEFSEENAKCWSAVGYFFARELAEKLGVTVGIIGCNWGGTSASYWMSREALEKDSDTREYLNDMDSKSEGKTDKQLEKEWLDYRRYDDEWNKKSAEFYAQHPDGSWDEVQEYAGKNLYPGPCNKFNPMCPTVLYESMLMRVCPYTLKGFIYYQGESDDHRPKTYFKLFRNLIQLWREDWGDLELPFLFVQLPMHRYKDDKDWKHWCVIREAQMNIFKTVKNTGIAVALDKGEFNEIHPKQKLPIGHRLALQALYGFYGFDNLKNEAFGPIYKDFEITDGGILISFEHCEGFTVQGEIKGFELAGENKEFMPANAEIKENTILLSTPEIAEPLYARYNWTNYGEVTVFGKNGLPLAPFRTCANDE